MRKIFLLILSFLLITQSQPLASAESINNIPICINVNGSYIKTDAEPVLDDGATYVPIRAICDALSVTDVVWVADEKKAVISDGNNEISILIGKDYAYINDEKVSVPGGSFLSYDRTFVPIRFVAESLSAEVDWDSETYTVLIEKEGNDVPQELILDRSYTDDDIYWMAKIINAESAGEPYEGKIAVGNVIMNRVLSDDYPDTIYGVIFDMNHGVQFEPVMNGTIYNKPTGESIIAAKAALEGENVAEGSLFFLNKDIAQSFWIVNNRVYLKTIGRHSFYL